MLDFIVRAAADFIARQGREGVMAANFWEVFKDFFLSLEDSDETIQSSSLLNLPNVQARIWTRLIQHQDIEVRRTLSIPADEKQVCPQEKTSVAMRFVVSPLILVAAGSDSVAFERAVRDKLVLVASTEARLDILGLDMDVVQNGLMNAQRSCLLRRELMKIRKYLANRQQ